MKEIPEEIRFSLDMLMFKNYLAWQNDNKMPVEENRKDFLEIIDMIWKKK